MHWWTFYADRIKGEEKRTRCAAQVEKARETSNVEEISSCLDIGTSPVRACALSIPSRAYGTYSLMSVPNG